MKALRSMSLAGGPPQALSTAQRLAVFAGFAGLFILLLAAFGVSFPNRAVWLGISLGLILAGVVWYSHALYAAHPPGIRNDGV